MIRVNNRARNCGRILGLTVALVILGSTGSMAGDADGILGYSMRLKNKDFTAGDGNPGGSGLLTDQKQLSVKPTKPALLTKRVEVRPYSHFYGWFVFWLQVN
jgi:hypothetical protein